jgi:predicted enzyme related to lactoylglutathione lyase
MAGQLSFFEIGVDDAEKGRAFYAGLFGWTFEPGPSGAGYVIGTPNIPGGMHGGDPGAMPYLFFDVDDIDQAIARITGLGGTVLDLDVEGDQDSQAEFGRFKLCEDDQGSPFGIHQRPA